MSLSLPGRVLSQTGPQSPVGVSGSLFSENGNRRIANASIRLIREGQPSWQQLVTGDSGEFNFQGLSPGHFVLQIRASGFKPLDEPVDLSFGSEHGLSIFLKTAENSLDNVGPGSSVSVHELSMPPAARDLFASGYRKLHLQNNPKAALKDFQSAVAKAPQYYEAYHQIGLAHLTLLDTPAAEENFRKSVELSGGEYADADIALGSLFVGRGDPSHAEPLLRHGLELSPHSWIALSELGAIELGRGHLAPARQSAQQAESLAPNQPLPHRLLAIINLQEKNYPALITELDAFIALEPDTPAGVRAKEIRAQAQKTLEAAAHPPQ